MSSKKVKVLSERASCEPETATHPDLVKQGSASDGKVKNSALILLEQGTVGAEKKSFAQQKPKETSHSKIVEENSALVRSAEGQDSLTEPPGWVLANSTIEDFVKTKKEWNIVETCADLAIVDIPKGKRESG